MKHHDIKYIMLTIVCCFLFTQLSAQIETVNNKGHQLQQLYNNIEQQMEKMKDKKYQPIIGVSAYHSTYRDSGVHNTYINAVIKAGGIPVIIPLTDNSTVINQLLSHLDGIIMTGGGDLKTSYYDEIPIKQMGKVDSLRDIYDLTLIKLASDKHIPMLGICRGEQLINVAFGGTLYQDLPTQYPSNIAHYQKEANEIATHNITFTPNSRLKHILCDSTTYKVNSFHHQAVKQIAPIFKVTAYSDDKVVEAFESNPLQNIIAVQFHPEFLILNGDNTMLNIFRDLVSRAVQYHKNTNSKL